MEKKSDIKPKIGVAPLSAIIIVSLLKDDGTENIDPTPETAR